MIITTTGDRVQDRRLESGGRQGRLPQGDRGGACSRGEVDLAVHSLKDVPDGAARRPAPVRDPGAGRPARRAPARRRAAACATCPPGARIGTTSLRRRAQVLRAAARPRRAGPARQRGHADPASCARGASTRSCSPWPAWLRLGRAGEVTRGARARRAAAGARAGRDRARVPRGRRGTAAAVAPLASRADGARGDGGARRSWPRSAAAATCRSARTRGRTASAAAARVRGREDGSSRRPRRAQRRGSGRARPRRSRRTSGPRGGGAAAASERSAPLPAGASLVTRQPGAGGRARGAPAGPRAPTVIEVPLSRSRRPRTPAPLRRRAARGSTATTGSCSPAPTRCARSADDASASLARVPPGAEDRDRSAPSTTRALRGASPGVAVALEPPTDFRAEGLLAAFEAVDGAGGSRFSCPPPTAPATSWPTGCAARGARWTWSTAYRTVAPAGACGARPARPWPRASTWSRFASPSAVEGFVGRVPPEGRRGRGPPSSVPSPSRRCPDRPASTCAWWPSPSTAEGLVAGDRAHCRSSQRLDTSAC